MRVLDVDKVDKRQLVAAAMDQTQNTEDLGEELHAACQQAYSEKFLEVEERLGRKECDKIPDMHDKKKARTSGGMATYLH